jgi:adenine-specific DNA-methyltransferase
VFSEDTNELVKKINPVDLAYFDPPYNQHPYGSNYFMLNIINGGTPVPIQNGVSGIAEDWQRSEYNKSAPAENAMDDLIKNTPAKYILISYNDEGIIPIEKFEKIVSKYGEWELLEQEYNTYRGSRNLRDRSNKVKELLWLIKKS